MKFHKNLFSLILLRFHYEGFHTRELKYAMWNMRHAWVYSKCSISLLSSNNNLKKGTLRIIHLFSKYNKKGALQSSFHFMLYYSKGSEF